MNPTRELMLSSLGKEFVVVGPGYGPVRNSISEYIRAFGPFDALVLEGSVYLSKHGHAGTYAWPDADSHTFADLFDHFKRVVVLNLIDDFHGSTTAQYEALFDNRVVTLSNAVGHDNFRFERFIKARRETWCPVGLDKIPHHLPPTYLLFPAALADDEFAIRKNARRDGVAVLGVQYFIRRQVVTLLRKEGVRVVTGDDWRFRVLRAVNGRTGWLSGQYRHMFMDALDRAKIAVTCSGTVGYPIRKYFEIPARGAALVAEFFENPVALGFRSGENCVALCADDATDAPAIIGRLLSDDGERNRIAEAGYELVWSRHRIRHRVQQLLDIVRAVGSDDLITTRWEDGRLRLILKSAQPTVTTALPQQRPPASVNPH